MAFDIAVDSRLTRAVENGNLGGMLSSLSRFSRWLLVWMVSLVVVGLLSYQAGSTLAHDKTVTGSSDPFSATSFSVQGIGQKPPKGVAKDIAFDEFWDLWKLLQEKYHVQPLDQGKMFYGAMSGLASSLGDPYTVFFEPQDAETFTDSLQGKFEGIGAEIGIKDDQLQVIAPLPDSPAARSGLLSGDAILMINGTSTEAMSVEQAVVMIRGQKGTTVTLNIARLSVTKDAKGKDKKDVKHFDVSIVRDTISVKSVRVSYPAPTIALIEINHFNADTADAFSDAVGQVLAKDVKGVIVDMRNDPGGFLDRATAVAGEWLGDAVIVQERRQGKIVDEYHGTGPARLKDMPTIVLVNEGSASAAEIVAGALQDAGVAKLVGMKTFGKGSVQDFTDFKDGSAVKITIAEWLTPKGRSINNVGIEPDVVIPRTDEDYHAQRDPQLQKALELLVGTSTPVTQP